MPLTQREDLHICYFAAQFHQTLVTYPVSCTKTFYTNVASQDRKGWLSPCMLTAFHRGSCGWLFWLFYRSAGCSQWNPAPPLALTILFHNILQHKKTHLFGSFVASIETCTVGWNNNCLYRRQLKKMMKHFYNTKSRYTIHVINWKNYTREKIISNIQLFVGMFPRHVKKKFFKHKHSSS